MQAKDVMTSPVVTIRPDTTVQAIVKTLLEKNISAVPVVDGEGKLAGIVSEGDLMRRVETGTEIHSWWLSLLFDEPEARARAYLKSHGTRALDVMTLEVVTVAPEMPLERIAPLLEKHRIKRVPVVDGNGVPVGVVSRANLLQGLAVRRTPTPVSADDHELRASLLAAINDTGIDTHLVTLTVTEGVAHMWGSVQSKAEQRALQVAVETMPGLKGVDDKIGILSRAALPSL